MFLINELFELLAFSSERHFSGCSRELELSLNFTIQQQMAGDRKISENSSDSFLVASTTRRRTRPRLEATLFGQ